MIRPVAIVDYKDQIRDLVRENWEESGIGFEIDVDFDTYASLQASGQLFALGAFDELDQIIGYVTVAIGPHLYNKSVIYCQSDSIFVTKAHRNGTAPGRLIVETERAAKMMGASFMLWQVGIAETGLSDAFERRLYAQIDRSYARWL